MTDLTYWTIESASARNLWFPSNLYCNSAKKFDTYEKAYKLAYESAEKARKENSECLEKNFQVKLYRVVSHRISQTENSFNHYKEWTVV